MPIFYHFTVKNEICWVCNIPDNMIYHYSIIFSDCSCSPPKASPHSICCVSFVLQLKDKLVCYYILPNPLFFSVSTCYPWSNHGCQRAQCWPLEPLGIPFFSKAQWPFLGMSKRKRLLFHAQSPAISVVYTRDTSMSPRVSAENCCGDMTREHWYPDKWPHTN